MGNNMVETRKTQIPAHKSNGGPEIRSVMEDHNRLLWYLLRSHLMFLLLAILNFIVIIPIFLCFPELMFVYLPYISMIVLHYYP